MEAKSAYRVIHVDKKQVYVKGWGNGYTVILAPVYYGPDENGPEVGDVLVPDKVKI